MPVPSYHPLSPRAAFWLMMVRGLALFALMLYAGYLWLGSGMPPHG